MHDRHHRYIGMQGQPGHSSVRHHRPVIRVAGDGALGIDQHCLTGGERLLGMPQAVTGFGATAAHRDEDEVRTLLRKLARQGEVYQVVCDLFYPRDSVRELAQLVAQLAQEQGGALSASVFRDAAGLGRKRAIQVLEFFDRVGYTRFHRDVHLLRVDSGVGERL